MEIDALIAKCADYLSMGQTDTQVTSLLTSEPYNLTLDAAFLVVIAGRILLQSEVNDG